MANESESFTSSVVGVVIAIVVIGAVALPIVNGLITAPEGGTAVVTDPTQVTIIKIIPVFLVLAVLMMVIKSFMNKN